MISDYLINAQALDGYAGLADINAQPCHYSSAILRSVLRSLEGKRFLFLLLVD